MIGIWLFWHDSQNKKILTFIHGLQKERCVICNFRYCHGPNSKDFAEKKEMYRYRFYGLICFNW